MEPKKKETEVTCWPPVFYADIPIQIILTGKLTEGENLWLKSLTNRLKDPKRASDTENEAFRLNHPGKEKA